MTWAETLDTALLRFFNSGLSNPVFDWLMPQLSHNPMFVPLVVLVCLALAVKGGRRARVALLLIVPALLLGDPLICNTLKHLIGRERPCWVVDGINVLVSKSHSGSMPSAHAFNWAAAAMMLFMFWPRSIWVMLPLTIAVGFSRIYNGVHYPSDVLVGWILGAGYGAWAIWTASMLWVVIGRRWFPIWWRRLPWLLQPELDVSGQDRPGETAMQNSARIAPGDQHHDIELHWLRLGYALVTLFLIGRLAYIGSGRIELSGDEAYQWVWSKHLALSYYSKPPMIAYTQRLGTLLWGDNEFGVRFFAPVISAVIGVMLIRFFSLAASAQLGCVMVLIAAATPLLAVGATLLTVDPLNVLFWTAAMLAGWRAVQPDGRAQHWLVVGLLMGLGFLSKYTALIQLVCWAVFFVLWPAARIHLRRPGPYLGLLVNVLCAVPVVVWNAQHGWPTLAHLADRGNFTQPIKFSLRYVIDFLGTEAAVLNPVFFLGMICAVLLFWRRGGRRDPLLLYCFSMGAPVFVLYLLQSLHARVLPNWIAPGVLPLFCLMVLYFNRLRPSVLARTGLYAGLLVGFVAVAVLHETDLVRTLTGRPLPVAIDPLRRVRGWRELAGIVGQTRAKLEAQTGRPTFIIAPHYTYVSEITFYLPEAKNAVRGVPRVYCIESERPHNQYFFLPNYRYSNRKGHNAIYFEPLPRPKRDTDPPPEPRPCPEQIQNKFESVTDLGVFKACYRGRPFWWFQLWDCRNLR